MSWKFKTILLVMMTMALACGFLHHLVSPATLNFERLHIFLFNLCSGGTLLIYFTEGGTTLSRRGMLFLTLAVAFALCAFLQWYVPAMLISACPCPSGRSGAHRPLRQPLSPLPCFPSGNRSHENFIRRLCCASPWG